MHIIITNLIQEGDKMTNLEKGRKLAKEHGGFYDKNKTWNALITFPFDNHVYRNRVETIVVRGNKEVFVKKKPNGEYFLPGGSKEKDSNDALQAENECREEARLNISDVENSGFQIKQINKPDERDDKHIWDGAITDIYVATYVSMYKGQIKKVDRDSFILSGKFYPIKQCLQFFKDEHREALKWYLKNHVGSDEIVVESMYKDGVDKFIYHNIKTPEALFEWMKSNISYANYTKLKSPEELYETRKGSCHDQSEFTYHALRKMHLDPGRLFVIEYDPSSGKGGETHSFSYYVKKKKYYWLETAWGNNKGIHGPYDNLNDLKNEVKKRWDKKRKYPELYISTVRNTKYGMTLDEFVNACTDDEMTEATLTSEKRNNLKTKTFGIPELRKYPLNDKSHVMAAIRFFNKVEPKYEEELAQNIIKAMKKFNISSSVVGDKNRLKKYL